MAGVTRRRFLTLAGAAAATAVAACRSDDPHEPATPTPADPATVALDRGVAWLLGQQDETGAFPSATYGFFADGQSLTPFVLLSLLQALGAAPPGADAAVDRMLALRGTDGASGFAGPVPDYPVYSTAMTLQCLRRLRPAEAEPSAAWLRTQQFRSTDGWGGHDANGGFGMGVRQPLRPPHAGHVDLSMSRRAMEALQGLPFEGRDDALGFVRRCGTADGGFVYSPVERALNKAGPETGYGSATCDGLLALLALDAADAPEVEPALTFLESIHRVDRNPGLEGGQMEVFATAMRGSYRAGSAQVFARTGRGPDGWRRKLRTAVVAEQQADGSWVNESNLQKEDDPLIATSFAVMALAWSRPDER